MWCGSPECATLACSLFGAKNKAQQLRKSFLPPPYLPKEMQIEKPASEGNLNIHLSTYELSVVNREGPSKSLFARLPFVSHCFWVALQASVYQMFALPQLPVNCLPLLSAK